MTIGTGYGGVLPPGLEPLPERGEGVVGTRVSEPARRRLRLKGAAWAVPAVAALVLAYSSRDDLAGLLLALVLAAAFAFLAAVNLAPALQGDRPALTIDADAVECHVPLSRVRVRLDAITQVRRLRRDLLLEARGGIRRRGRSTRERWAAISYVHAFEVSRDDLAGYLSLRAQPSRPAL
jgi:hypothetical protein